MIGANNSPLNMFTGGGNEAFQRGMAIGDANSPVSPIARAMQATLEKYNSHLASQQEQQNKMQLMERQYSLQGQNAVNVAKQKVAQTTPQLSPEMAAIDPLHPEDPKYLRTVGGVQMYPQPLYDENGRIKGYKYVNPRALSMMDMMNPQGEGIANTADDQAAILLKELQDAQAGQPQGI